MTATHSSTRRRFFARAGAALSAPLAVGMATAAGASGSDGAEAREAADQIRTLQQRLARYVNAGESAGLADLFVSPAEVRGVSQLRRLRSADFGSNDSVEVAASGRSAFGRFHCIAETEVAAEIEGTVAEMARLQGNGFRADEVACVVEAEFVRRDGTWKFRQLSVQPA